MRQFLFACAMLCACHDQSVDVGYSAPDEIPPDAATPTAFGTPRWAIDLGTTYADTATAVAITSTGDVVAAGMFGGPNNSVGISTPTGFVTQRAASDGSERWTATMTTLADLSYVTVAGVALDPNDDSVVVTGSYMGSVDFGGQTLSLAEPPEPAYGDTFVARYSSTGELQWVTGLSSGIDVEGVAIATDSAGHAIVTGVFNNGTLTFGSATYSEPTGSDNAAFLVAYDSSGNQLWGKGFVSASGPSATTVTVDASDNVLIAGAFVGPTSFGGGTLMSTGPAAFLARFHSDGSYFASHVVTTDATFPTQVVVDASGHAIVQTIPTSPGPCGLFAIDGSDNDLWSASIAGNAGMSPQLRTLAATPTGSVLSSAWDDFTSSHMEVVAFDSGGSASTSTFGSRVSGQGFNTRAHATATSSSGATAFVGDYTGTIQLAGSALTAQMLVGSDVDPDPVTDAFVVVVDP